MTATPPGSPTPTAPNPNVVMGLLVDADGNEFGQIADIPSFVTDEPLPPTQGGDG